MSSNSTSLLLSEAVDLYKQDKLFEAEEACEKAVGLDPNNLTALNTLLSLNFERGNYETAITNTLRALSLLRAQGVESEETQLLQRRIAECYLYLSKPGYVKAIAKDVKDDEARTFLLAAAERMQMVHDQVDPATQRRLVIDRIPSLKQCLSQLPEYFPTGHDQAESLFDEALQTRVTPQDDISLLFCGSGDARHVFATISSTASREREIGEQLCRNIHITMVDHSPPVFARNLLMFEMLSHYADLKCRNAQGYEDMKTVMAYIYISHLLPPFVYEKMLEYIDILLHKLNSGQLSTAGLIVAPKDIPAITKVLEHWKRGLGAEYRVADVRNYVTQAIDADGCLAPALDLARAGEFDRKSLRRLGVLFSSPDFVESRDLPSYDPLLRFSKDGETEELSTCINHNWKINSTLFDVDLKAVRGENYGIFTTLEFLPISIVNSFKSVVDTPYLTIPDFGEILDTLSKSLSEIRSRLTIELVISDMCDAMDRIRFDMLEHRAELTAHALGSKQYPRTYDRIHLSNIPDYTGGPLTAFIFSHPLLNKDRPSTLQYRCLLNPSRFRGHADFQSEYLNMYDDDQISQHFNFRRQPSAADSNPKRHELAASTDEYMSAFILEYYMIWERQDEGSVSPNKLLSRPNLEKWAYSMLLKICLPYYRPLIVDRAVEAPLNLMYFFRLMVKLSEVGYPGHWLSEIVREACSGIIYTTARPPTQLITTPEVLDVDDPAVTLNLRAWAAELTSLLTIWHNLLPFGHISPLDSLPPLSTISQYSVEFPLFKSGNPDSPHFMMLFWNVEVHHQHPTDIRKYLLGIPTAIQGVHIVTCFKHDVHTNTSTFWLRDDVVQNMRSGGWKVYITRTDDWTVESKGVNVFNGVIKLGQWV